MAGFGAVAAAVRGHATTGEPDDPRCETFKKHEDLAVAGDDGFPSATSDGTENLADGGSCAHDEPFGNGILRVGMKRALIVDAANVGSDEAGADESDLDAVEGEFGSDGVGEGADGKFAHGVGGDTGTGSPTGDAANENQTATGLRDLRERGVERANQAEDVGFELAAVIFDGEIGERADNAKAGIGDDDVEFAVSVDGFRDGVVEVAVAGDVSGNNEGRFVAGGGDSLGESVEKFAAAGGEGEVSASGSELEGKFFADAGRGAGDEDGLGVEEIGHGWIV